MSNKRNRTPSEYIGYDLDLYFLCLSLRNVVKALSYLHIVKRSHVLLAKKWKWIQKFRHRRISSTSRNKISEYIVDETILQVGTEYIWLWVAIESENGQILAQDITKRETCSLPSAFCQVLLDTMEIILFPPMAVHGILKPVSFSKWIIIFILL